MSSRQEALCGTSTVYTADSQVRLPRVAIMPWKEAEHPSGGPFRDPVSPGPASPERRERPPTRHRHASPIEPILVSGVNGRSPGTPSDHARADNAQRNLRTIVLGYASTDGQQRDRASADLRRQADEITAECERRGLRLLEVVREQERQHGRPQERPGLAYALGRIAAGAGCGLVVLELSTLSHSLAELGRVLEWLAGREARFVAVRPGLDTEEDAGHLAAQTIIEVSCWERQRLVERTRSGMRAARRKGPASVSDNPELRDRIAAMRAAGTTLQGIADHLNSQGIPTVRGGSKWRPSSVQAAAGYQRPPASQALDLRLWRT